MPQGCDVYTTQVEEYWDGKLPEKVVRQIEDHLFDCEKCRRDFFI